MKKFFQLFWQLLIFPVLYVPYHFINNVLIVEWLGCGCPKIDNQGNTIDNYFNANDFTAIFWSVIALIVIAISLFSMRKLTEWYSKLIYLLFIGIGSFFIAFMFYFSMQWK